MAIVAAQQRQQVEEYVGLAGRSPHLDETAIVGPTDREALRV